MPAPSRVIATPLFPRLRKSSAQDSSYVLTSSMSLMRSGPDSRLLCEPVESVGPVDSVRSGFLHVVRGDSGKESDIGFSVDDDAGPAIIQAKKRRTAELQGEVWRQQGFKFRDHPLGARASIENKRTAVCLCILVWPKNCALLPDIKLIYLDTSLYLVRVS